MGEEPHSGGKQQLQVHLWLSQDFPILDEFDVPQIHLELFELHYTIQWVLCNVAKEYSNKNIKQKHTFVCFVTFWETQWCRMATPGEPNQTRPDQTRLD